MIKEIWKPIPIVPYNKNYEVSNLGRVRRITSACSTHAGKILKADVARNGYLRVVLYHKSKRKRISVHRLVGLTFIPNLENLPYINHKDGNKDNNIVSNLEWVTPKQNGHHASVNNLSGKGNSKLTPEQVKYIKAYYKKGEPKLSQRQLAEKFGVTRMCINAIITERNWKHIN